MKPIYENKDFAVYRYELISKHVYVVGIKKSDGELKGFLTVGGGLGDSTNHAWAYATSQAAIQGGRDAIKRYNG